MQKGFCFGRIITAELCTHNALDQVLSHPQHYICDHGAFHGTHAWSRGPPMAGTPLARETNFGDDQWHDSTHSVSAEMLLLKHYIDSELYIAMLTLSMHFSGLHAIIKLLL